MKNIFGKQLSDYQHLNKIKKFGHLDAHLQGLKDSGRELKFNGNASLKDSVVSGNSFGQYFDNLSAIDAEIQETMFLSTGIEEYVPVKSEVVGAKFYDMQVMTPFGEADFIDPLGTNVNVSNVTYDTKPAPLFTSGLNFEWSADEMESAVFAGVPLRTDLIKATTTGCLTGMHKATMFGSKIKKQTGLTNSKVVPVAQASSTFSESKDLAADINKYVEVMKSSTNNIIQQSLVKDLTIYLPSEQFSYLAVTPYGTNNDKTIMDFLSRNNAWTASTGMPLIFKETVAFKGAGTSGKDRMLIAFKDINIMEVAVQKQPYIRAVIDDGDKVVGKVRYNMGALQFKIPKACLYVDGI